MTSPLVLPRRVRVMDVPGLPDTLRSFGILLPDEAARMDRIERSTYVLLWNNGEGERWRCGRCNAIHDHYTLFCVERPFRGVREALYAYWKHAVVRDQDLSPVQRARRRDVASALGVEDGIPDLAQHHPQMARALGTREGSTQYGGLMLGTVDPVSSAKAYQLASRINSKARRPVVRL